MHYLGHVLPPDTPGAPWRAIFAELGGLVVEAPTWAELGRAAPPAVHDALDQMRVARVRPPVPRSVIDLRALGAVLLLPVEALSWTALAGEHGYSSFSMQAGLLERMRRTAAAQGRPMSLLLTEAAADWIQANEAGDPG